MGEHFVSFEPNVVVRAYPQWMEFHFTIVKPKGPPVHCTLRIPLASPPVDGQGARIVEAFRVARAAGNAPFATLSKARFLVIFLAGFFALTGVAIALAYLLQRGP